MTLTCPKCRRLNPSEAAYCHFDGSVLGNGHAHHGPINPATAPFPMPFVFPSGQSCHNFDQLALGCMRNWSTARDLVRQGMLKNFFGGVGRADLAIAADEAARYPDKDRGLAELLSKLPTQSEAKPKLAVKPLELDLGVLPVGQDKRVEVRLSNEGLGLLYGSVQCDDSTFWLALLNVPVGTNRKMFQTVDEAVIRLMVRGQNLRAGNKPLEATLTVESNGGTQTIAVRATVPVKPYPDGVLAGAVTPRQIAEKAKASPKEAAVLFENGAVGKWYESNGWTYPVQGPSASGLGAVQQFFEALGLTPAPKVELAVTSLSLSGPPGAALRSSLELRTPEKRPIFAHAHSDQPWLKVGRAVAKGRTVSLPLEVPVVPHCPGETLHAKLSVTSNGNQHFEVPVRLAIAAEAAAAAFVPVMNMMEVMSTPAPAAARGGWQRPEPVVPVATAGTARPSANLPTAAAPAPVRRTTAAVPARVAAPPAEPVKRPSRILALVPVLLLMLGMSVAAGHDLYRWVRPSNVDTLVQSSGAGELGTELVDTNPRIDLQFFEDKQTFRITATGAKGEADDKEEVKIWADPTMQFGIATRDNSLKGRGKFKKLTFSEDGWTNNTVIKVDNAQLLFGQKPFYRDDNGKPVTAGWKGEWYGDWRSMKKPLGNDAKGRPRNGYESVWAIEEKHLVVTQTVEIIPGPQSNILDTCLIRYRLTNEDGKSHSVGLRFLLDTYIGENDGVPFDVGGTLCDTDKQFARPEDVPDYIQACEKDDLANPGTIARIGLKLAPLDVPNRVTLGAWPDSRLRERQPVRARGCNQEKTGWDVPVLSMKTLDPNDSAVVIYWDPKDLKPNESREVGFTYGLGTVSGGEGKGKLALTAGGSFVPGGTFTVSAYMSNPTPGQKVTLTLPAGLEFADGSATLPVPPPAADVASHNSVVTWKVRAAQTGTYKLRATTSNGDAQTLDVNIKPQVKGIFGN